MALLIELLVTLQGESKIIPELAAWNLPQDDTIKLAQRS